MLETRLVATISVRGAAQTETTAVAAIPAQFLSWPVVANTTVVTSRRIASQNSVLTTD